MIERGYCDAGNPLFFQPEPISVNEVLTDNKPLMDYTKCNWLVAYVNKGESPTASTIEFGNTTQAYNESYNSIDALKSALYNGKGILYSGTTKFVAGTNNTASAVSTNLAKECAIIWKNGSVSNHYIYGGWVTKSSEAFDCNDLDYQANIVDN